MRGRTLRRHHEGDEAGIAAVALIGHEEYAIFHSFELVESEVQIAQRGPVTADVDDVTTAPVEYKPPLRREA